MFITTATVMYSLGHGLRTLPAVPRLTQPSTLRGTVHAECYIVASFLVLDVTVFCKPVNASEATRQLLCCLAFNLHNFGLSEIQLKFVVVPLA